MPRGSWELPVHFAQGGSILTRTAVGEQKDAATGISKAAKKVLRFLPVLEFDASTVTEIKAKCDGASVTISEQTIRRSLKGLKEQGYAHEKGSGEKNDPKRYWRTEKQFETRVEDEQKDDQKWCPTFSDTPVENDGNDSEAQKVTPIRPDLKVVDSPKPGTPEEFAQRFEGYVISEERLEKCREWASQRSYAAVDIETKGKNSNEATLYTKATVRLVTLYADGKTWWLDCDYLPDECVAAVLRGLEPEHKPKYFHNSAFDVPRIHRRFGVMLDKGVLDTQIASRSARAGEWEEVQKGNKTVRPQKKHELDECLRREGVAEIPKVKQKWTGDLTEQHLIYAADDVRYLEELYSRLYGRIEDIGASAAYDTIADTLNIFLEAACLKVPLDIKKLEAIQEQTSLEKDKAEQTLRSLAQKHASHPEGLEWVWGNTQKHTTPEGPGRNGMNRLLSLVGVKLSSLEEQTLLDNRDAHPIVKALYDYGKAAKIHSKYARILSDFTDECGDLCSQANVVGAVTSRVTYKDPNIQGFHKRTTKRYRECVRAPEGHLMVKADYEQQELRIAAFWSQDENLMSAFANGEDVYMRVAEKIVGEPVSRGTEQGDRARAAAKRAVLGYLYGLGPDKYRTNVYKDTGSEVSLEVAHRDREAFRSAFPGFYKWQKSYGSHKDECNLPKPDRWETRSVRGWRRVVAGQYGRKSDWMKENNVPAEWIPKYTDRLNGPIQSTAGDILYLTLQKLNGDFGDYPGTRFLFSVHDEIVLTAPEDIAEDVLRWLKSRMVEALEEVLCPELGGPGSVEGGGGPNWGAVDKWEVAGPLLIPKRI